MSYEEKYKEALKRADSLTEKYGGREFAEYVFPELAESEDERIRKELIEAFEVYDIESSWNLIPVKRILAWLEKRNIDKIRQEIERLKQMGSIGLNEYDAGFENGRGELCDELLAFIDSLPEEKPDKTDELPRYYGN